MNIKEIVYDFSTEKRDLDQLYQKFMALKPEEGQEIAYHLLEKRFTGQLNLDKSITNKLLGAGLVSSGAGAGVATAVASGVGVTKLSAFGATLALGSTPIGWALGAAAAGAVVGYVAFKKGKKLLGDQKDIENTQKITLDGGGHVEERILNPYVFYLLKNFQDHVRNKKDLEKILESKVEFNKDIESEAELDVLEEIMELESKIYDNKHLSEREECVFGPLNYLIEKMERGGEEKTAEKLREDSTIFATLNLMLLNEALGFLDDLKQ